MPQWLRQSPVTAIFPGGPISPLVPLSWAPREGRKCSPTKAGLVQSSGGQGLGGSGESQCYKDPNFPFDVPLPPREGPSQHPSTPQGTDSPGPPPPTPQGDILTSADLCRPF